MHIFKVFIVFAAIMQSVWLKPIAKSSSVLKSLFETDDTVAERTKRQPEFFNFIHHLIEKHANCADQYLKAVPPKGNYRPYDMYIYDSDLKRLNSGTVLQATATTRTPLKQLQIQFRTRQPIAKNNHQCTQLEICPLHKPSRDKGDPQINVSVDINKNDKTTGGRMDQLRIRQPIFIAADQHQANNKMLEDIMKDNELAEMVSSIERPFNHFHDELKNNQEPIGLDRSPSQQFSNHFYGLHLNSSKQAKSAEPKRDESMKGYSFISDFYSENGRKKPAFKLGKQNLQFQNKAKPTVCPPCKATAEKGVVRNTVLGLSPSSYTSQTVSLPFIKPTLSVGGYSVESRNEPYSKRFKTASASSSSPPQIQTISSRAPTLSTSLRQKSVISSTKLKSRSKGLSESYGNSFPTSLASKSPVVSSYQNSDESGISTTNFRVPTISSRTQTLSISKGKNNLVSSPMLGASSVDLTPSYGTSSTTPLAYKTQVITSDQSSEGYIVESSTEAHSRSDTFDTSTNFTSLVPSFFESTTLNTTLSTHSTIPTKYISSVVHTTHVPPVVSSSTARSEYPMLSQSLTTSTSSEELTSANIHQTSSDFPLASTIFPLASTISTSSERPTLATSIDSENLITSSETSELDTLSGHQTLSTSLQQSIPNSSSRKSFALSRSSTSLVALRNPAPSDPSETFSNSSTTKTPADARSSANQNFVSSTALTSLNSSKSSVVSRPVMKPLLGSITSDTSTFPPMSMNSVFLNNLESTTKTIVPETTESTTSSANNFERISETSISTRFSKAQILFDDETNLSTTTEALIIDSTSAIGISSAFFDTTAEPIISFEEPNNFDDVPKNVMHQKTTGEMTSFTVPITSTLPSTSKSFSEDLPDSEDTQNSEPQELFNSRETPKNSSSSINSASTISTSALGSTFETPTIDSATQFFPTSPKTSFSLFIEPPIVPSNKQNNSESQESRSQNLESQLLGSIRSESSQQELNENSCGLCDANVDPLKALKQCLCSNKPKPAAASQTMPASAEPKQTHNDLELSKFIEYLEDILIRKQNSKERRIRTTTIASNDATNLEDIIKKLRCLKLPQTEIPTQIRNRIFNIRQQIMLQFNGTDIAAPNKSTNVANDLQELTKDLEMILWMKNLQHLEESLTSLKLNKNSNVTEISERIKKLKSENNDYFMKWLMAILEKSMRMEAAVSSTTTLDYDFLTTTKLPPVSSNLKKFEKKQESEALSYDVSSIPDFTTQSASILSMAEPNREMKLQKPENYEQELAGETTTSNSSSANTSTTNIKLKQESSRVQPIARKRIKQPKAEKGESIAEFQYIAPSGHNPEVTSLTTQAPKKQQIVLGSTKELNSGHKSEKSFKNPLKYKPAKISLIPIKGNGKFDLTKLKDIHASFAENNSKSKKFLEKTNLSQFVTQKPKTLKTRRESYAEPILSEIFPAYKSKQPLSLYWQIEKKPKPCKNKSKVRKQFSLTDEDTSYIDCFDYDDDGDDDDDDEEDATSIERIISKKAYELPSFSELNT